jgi:hypothetical protein
MESSVFIDKCPGCKRTLKIDSAVSGPLARCPACGAVLKVLVPATAGRKRGSRGVRSSEDTIGVLALWICGVGALVTIGSIVGVLAVGLSKPGTPTPGVPPVVQRPVPAPAPVTITPPAALVRDTNDVSTPPSALPDEPVSGVDRATTQPQPVDVAVTPKPEPTTPTTTTPVEPAEGEPELPVPTGLLARLGGVRADVFSHRQSAGEAGVLWRPAPMGKHFVFFTLAIRNPTPQPTQLFFDPKASSRAVRLTNASGESADALGRLLPTAAPPRQFDTTPLDLDPREEVSDLVVAFIVPAHWSEATLDGPGFTTGRIRLPAPDDGDGVQPDETVGWWRRVPEQPMRLRYVNPLLGTLADPRVERMLITTDGRPGRVSVSVPYAGVTGSIEWPAGKSRTLVGAIELRRGGAGLRGHVRFADRGHVLVVYASDEPFEQIIYRK